MFKFVIVLALVAGVLADVKVPEITEDQKTLIRNTLKAQCKKTGNEAAAAEIETAAADFVNCVKGLFDPESMKEEIEEAKPNGALDEVFKKHCEKSPQLKTCIHTLTSKVAVCMDPAIKDQMGLINNGTDQLLDFVCYKDGDRIALFIAEQGPECFMSKSELIKDCGNKIKESVPNSIEGVKGMSINEHCAKFDEMSECVVKALEQCDTPTPGNMAEALFRFVRNGSPCPKH